MIDKSPFFDYYRQVLEPLERLGLMEMNPAKGDMYITLFALYAAAGITIEEHKEITKESPDPKIRLEVLKKLERFAKNMRMYLTVLGASIGDEAPKMEKGISIHVLSDPDKEDPEKKLLPLLTIILSKRRTWRTLWLKPSDHFNVINY